MTKMTAFGTMVAWAVFWVLGGLAVLTPVGEPMQVPAVLVAFLGLVAGSLGFLRLREPAYAALIRAR